jgi:DsbC/DsbD-like thiol-disulfide interchange protein
MVHSFRTTLFHALGIALLPVAAATTSVQAQDASAWTGNAHSQVRLIAGKNPAGQQPLRAGIEIRLAPGWKTYWRYPGDSGIPPQFDFGGSENVRSVQVLWPAPRRFSDPGGQFIGYEGRVIMPLRVVPEDSQRPVQLRLDYGVCEILCVPAQVEARLKLSGGGGAQEPALAAAEARVPRRAAVGEDRALAIREVRRVESKERPRILVEVAAPPTSAVDLFVEGPTPEWALPLPKSLSPPPAPGLRHFVFELDGLPAGASTEGAELTFTLVADTGAIEVKTRLD